MKEHRSDPQFSTTLAHGMQLLECFKFDNPALNNKELATLTGLSKATVSRLTYTLAQQGLIQFDVQLRRYMLGPTALSLGHPLLASLTVRQVAQPLMRDLALAVDGTVNLAMRDRDRMVYVDSYRGHRSPTFCPEIGAWVPVLTSTVGRSWLYRVSPTIRSSFIEKIRFHLPAEWNKYEINMRRSWRELDEQGYCVSVGGESVREMDAVGAPLHTEVDGTILTFNCSVLRARASQDLLHRIMGPGLVSLVKQVDNLLAKG
jgi:DNA-binding IclR family transcriptional regulator